MPRKNGVAVLNNYAQMVHDMDEGYKAVMVILSDHLNKKKYIQQDFFKSYGHVEKMQKPMLPEKVNLLKKKFF